MLRRDRPSTVLRFACGGGAGTSRGLRRRHVRPDRRAHRPLLRHAAVHHRPVVVVIVWLILNAFAFAGRWDPYPFILLNLAFSLQAAYAAPLILLAQTRQADRDKNLEERAEKHHEEQVRLAEERVAAIKAETDKLSNLLVSNTNLTREDKELTEQVAELTREIRGLLTRS